MYFSDWNIYKCLYKYIGALYSSITIPFSRFVHRIQSQLLVFWRWQWLCEILKRLPATCPICYTYERQGYTTAGTSGLLQYWFFQRRRIVWKKMDCLMRFRRTGNDNAIYITVHLFEYSFLGTIHERTPLQQYAMTPFT